jgi:rRNA-processing protein FCF1
MVKKVILDTNSLMVKNIFTMLKESLDFNYDPYIVEGTIKELEKISSLGNGKENRDAKLALKLIEAKKVKILPDIKSYVDNSLIEYSKENLVLTQDKELKLLLNKPYLTIRQQSYVVIVK